MSLNFSISRTVRSQIASSREEVRSSRSATSGAGSRAWPGAGEPVGDAPPHDVGRVHDVAQDAVRLAVLRVVMPEDGVDELRRQRPVAEDPGADVGVVGSEHDVLGHLEGDPLGDHVPDAVQVLVDEIPQRELADVVQQRRREHLVGVLDAELPHEKVGGDRDGDRVPPQPPAGQVVAGDRGLHEGAHAHRHHQLQQTLPAEQHDGLAHGADMGRKAEIGRVGQLEDVRGQPRVVFQDVFDLGRSGFRVLQQRQQAGGRRRHAREGSDLLHDVPDVGFVQLDLLGCAGHRL